MEVETQLLKVKKCLLWSAVAWVLRAAPPCLLFDGLFVCFKCCSCCQCSNVCLKSPGYVAQKPKILKLESPESKKTKTPVGENRSDIYCFLLTVFLLSFLAELRRHEASSQLHGRSHARNEHVSKNTSRLREASEIPFYRGSFIFHVSSHHFHFSLLIIFSPALIILLRLCCFFRGPGGRGPWPGPNANSVSDEFWYCTNVVEGSIGQV